MREVVAVGDCTLDHFGLVDRFLDPGMKVEMSKFSVQGGGAAATAAVVLARWGAETTFVGKVGDDPRGDQIEATLSDEGVDTTGLIHESNAVSQFSFVALERESGERKLMFTRGSVSSLSADDVELQYLEEASYLLVDGVAPEAQAAAMRRATEYGVPVILDASDLDPSGSELIELSDYVITSERFASRLTGVGELDAICEAMLEAGPDTVAVTLGDEGVVGASGERPGTVRESAHEVDVVDTTGSGDIFAGAFTYGVLEGWDLERTLRTANVTAGLSCSGIGGRGAIPTLDEVQSHL